MSNRTVGLDAIESLEKAYATAQKINDKDPVSGSQSRQFGGARKAEVKGRRIYGQPDSSLILAPLVIK